MLKGWFLLFSLSKWNNELKKKTEEIQQLVNDQNLGNQEAKH